MIQTIHYTNKNFPIPSNLIMERILNLEEKLEGQSLKIKSVFNEKDNDPSMIIFYSTDDEIYRFKDFSTGEYGDAVDIVLGLYKLEDRQKAYRKILEIFKDDTDIPRLRISSVKITKEVSEFKIRKWLNVDAEYWKQFGIGGTFLNKYNIKPLESYTIKMTKGGEVSTMDFDHKKCYGYFNMKGELCKIYQPARKEAKFLKTKDLTQGEEQLTYDKKCLIIASSLKDIGAFKSMKFPDIDLVAPDSENVTITPEQITKYRQHYQYIFTMFDNDVPGMNAMKKYKELYNIPYIYFNIEKDIADCVKQHGVESTKIFFKPIFKDAIKRSKNT
jgi:hypothetical protein